MSNEISKSLKKKWDRKRKRAQHMIEQEVNIKCSDFPTQNLVICNAGLVSGLTRETVLRESVVYGNVANVIMIPGQSFCFIQYQDVSSAEKAMESMNGKLSIGQNKSVIYLLYTYEIPDATENDESDILPTGLTVIPNAVTELEEKDLLACINWDENNSTSAMKHRQVKHFGYEFYYDTNNVDRNKPLDEKIPEKCEIVWSNLRELNFNIPHVVNQLTVNKYTPGQGIPPHVDTHSAFESPIYSLSLGSDVVMEFKNDEKQHCSVHLPQRSLLVMDRESRYAWTHGITPRTMDIIKTDNGLTVHKRGTRTSFTFRTIRENGICDCSYPEYCDSQKNIISGIDENGSNDQEIIDKTAAKLEAMHVHNVYEQIATHFSDTRHKPWPNVQKFVENIPVGGILVDVGCGNGKYFKNDYNIAQLGCDRSENLALVCQSRGFQVSTCDCLYLPFRDNIADAVISIAVVHHLANEKRRLQAVGQIVRILKRNGVALIYVWAKNQAVQNKKSNYLKKNDENTTISTATQKLENINKSGDLPNLPVHENRTQFKQKDMLVPWKLKNCSNLNSKSENENNCSTEKESNNPEIFLRYYHVFDEGELEKLCLKIDGVAIEKSFYDQGNWCVILKKL